MKKGIHPRVQEVIFKDGSSDFAFVSVSTMKSDETMVWPEDGKTYPVIRLEVTSASHPFYTGTHKVMDTEGRLERFKNKYAKAQAKK
jgi:large subunit ribosomal protein L31